MDKKRKETIIREINYWKKTKLLPEQYCDFLLTLYTEGDYENKQSNSSSTSNFSIVIPVLVTISLFLLIVLVLYFTEFSLGLQIVIGIFFTLAILLLAKKARFQSTIQGQLALFLAAFILFLFTIEIGNRVLDGHRMYQIAAVLGHCLLWLAAGWKWRIWFFIIAGTLGVIVLLIFLIR